MADGGGLIGQGERMSVHPLLYLEGVKEDIIKEWVALLHSSNTSYARRPLEELHATTQECLEAYLTAIRSENFEPLNRFIGRIIATRGAMNFPEHEVVDAFRAFRKIASDHLLAGLMGGDVEIESVSDVLDALFQVVDYAILRFSEIYYTRRAQRPH
jgi:hypothetical protein